MEKIEFVTIEDFHERLKVLSTEETLCVRVKLDDISSLDSYAMCFTDISFLIEFGAGSDFATVRAMKIVLSDAEEEEEESSDEGEVGQLIIPRSTQDAEEEDTLIVNPYGWANYGCVGFEGFEPDDTEDEGENGDTLVL